MSSQTALSVCNLALLSVGARAQVSSISPSDGSTAGDACTTYYSFVYESLARAAYWNCLRKQAFLSLLAAAQGTPENPNGVAPFPPQPWLYSYLLPPDCLKARCILPNALAGSVTGVPLTPVNNTASTLYGGYGQVPFAIAYDTDSSGNPITIVLTNQTQAQLIYTVNQPNPSVWDSQFTSAMVASLASYLVPALSLNMPLMQGQIKIAEMIIAQARSADANEGFNTQNREAEWILARNGSGGQSYGQYYTNVGMYNDMAWPAY
jgi:hypothetical protein